MSGSTPPQPPAGQPGPTPPSYGTTPPPYGATPPPYGQPPAYQGQAYPSAQGQAYPTAYGYGAYPAGPKTNTLSVFALIASIAGFIWLLPLIGSVAGAIMGHLALGQIKRTGEKGYGMALAGVIVGWVGVALAVIGVVIIIGLIGWSVENGARYGS